MLVNRIKTLGLFQWEVVAGPTIYDSAGFDSPGASAQRQTLYSYDSVGPTRLCRFVVAVSDDEIYRSDSVLQRLMGLS